MFKKKGLPRLEEELLEIEKNEPVESWRIFKIISEFVAGFELLRKYDLAVTFFGSARCKSDQQTYKDAKELARRLSKEGFAIITGGGPGIMEAANRGASDAQGESIGLNIELSSGQRINPYVKKSESFHYFFIRKVMLSFSSEVYVYFPGGFGTMDEFFELITLIQTEKISNVPIVLFGKDYWEPFLSLIEKHLYEKYQTIDKKDMEIYKLVDSVDEAVEYIKNKTK